MNSKKNLNKNTLYLYHGGGYDGCFWEWNACILDNNKQFKDLYSSGYAGIKDISKLKYYILKKDTFETHRIKNNEVQILDFNGSFLLGIAKKLNELGITLKSNCDICKNKFDVLNMYPINDKSDGGIVVSYHDLVCEDCYNENSCSYCGDFSIDSEKYYLEYSGQDKCEYCIEDHDIIKNIEYFINNETKIDISKYLNDSNIFDNLEHIRLDKLKNFDSLLINLENKDIINKLIDKINYQLNYYNPNQYNLFS